MNPDSQYVVGDSTKDGEEVEVWDGSEHHRGTSNVEKSPPEDGEEQETVRRGSRPEGHCDIVHVKTKNNKDKNGTLLESMSIDFPEGAITAILGPSGSGKTTLLSVITDSVQSNIVAKANVNLPGASAFVPQEDHLHGFFTCRSYLKHYGRLAGMDHGRGENSENDIIDLLGKLGLADQADTIVGDVFLKGLSGGQKRRLSVALEALTRPKNFFLDEPTSGLDAESAYRVMVFLKSYVRDSPGRRVILTIHQPSSFIWQLVDHAVLLSKGQLMYQGPREGMEHFFTFAGSPTPPNYNPADHYVTAVNDEFRNDDRILSVEQWKDKFQEYLRHQKEQEQEQQEPEQPSRHPHRTASMIEAAGKADLETQRRSKSGSPFVIFELTYRYFLNLWFNPGILGTRVAMYGMLALMVGLLFQNLGDRTDMESIQSRTAVLFYCVAFFIFMSVAVLPFTVIERSIVDKEVRNGYYHSSLYHISQALCTIPAAALLALLTTVIIIPLTKLNEPLWYFLTMFLSLLCSEALAQLVSHVVPHFVIGMAMIAGLYGFFMLFQGFMLIPSEFPSWLRWTYNVAFHTYAWRTFMHSEFDGDDVVFDADSPFPTGRSVLETYEIDDVDRRSDMIVLLGYCLIIHAMSLIVLHLRYTLFRGVVESTTTKNNDGRTSTA